MSKRIAFTPPPKTQSVAAGDAWVKKRVPDVEEPLKRLQVEIPASLHARVKAGAAERGHRTMSDMVRAWLEVEFPPK
ncbi:MAG: hypothetical protein AAF950_18515 [Pseudomonadota bacterium]